MKKLLCKNPYCKSNNFNKKKINFKSQNDLLRHLNTHEICHGYYSSAQLEEMEQNASQSEIEKSSMNISNKQENLEDPETFMMDVYADGCQLVKYCDLETQNKFFKRLEEAVEIDKKLYKAIDNISKTYADKDKWENNFLEVLKNLDDKIEHAAEDIENLAYIWLGELHDHMETYESIFDNSMDIYYELCEMESCVQNYNCEDHLSEEVKQVYDTYIKAETINKVTLKNDVDELLSYCQWYIENHYKYVSMYVKSVADNIKRQLGDKIQFSSKFEFLKQPVAIAYDSMVQKDVETAQDNELEDISHISTSNKQEKFEDHNTVIMDQLEDIVCKGCSEIFKNNSILKHIFNQYVYCIDKYTDTEIELLERNSKEHYNHKKIIAQRERRKNNNRQFEAISRRLKKSIARLTDWSGIYNTEKEYKLSKKLSEVKWAMKQKVSYMTKQRCEVWGGHLFDGIDVENWKKDIEDEIYETKNFLNHEIDSSINHYTKSYLNHTSFEIQYDSVIYVSNKRKYRILKRSIQRDIKELLHYIEWRLRNSYEYILCNTVILADNIKENLGKEIPSYSAIKLKERNHVEQQPFKTLKENSLSAEPTLSFCPHCLEERECDYELSHSTEEELATKYENNYNFNEESVEVAKKINEKWLILDLCYHRHKFCGGYKKIQHLKDSKMEIDLTIKKLEMIVSKTIELELPFSPFNKIGKIDNMDHPHHSCIFSRLADFSKHLTSNLHNNLVEDAKHHNLLKQNIVSNVETDKKIQEQNIPDLAPGDLPLSIRVENLLDEIRSNFGNPKLEEKVKRLCVFLEKEMYICMEYYISFVKQFEGKFNSMLNALKSKFKYSIEKYAETEDHEYTSWGFQWINEKFILLKFDELRLEMYKDFKHFRMQMDEFIIKNLNHTTDEDSIGFLKYQENYTKTIEKIKEIHCTKLKEELDFQLSKKNEWCAELLVCKGCAKGITGMALKHLNYFVKCKKKYTEAEIELLKKDAKDQNSIKYQFEIEFEASLQDASNEMDFMKLNHQLQEMQLMFHTNKTLFKCFGNLEYSLSKGLDKLMYLDVERARLWVEKLYISIDKPSVPNPLVIVKGKLYFSPKYYIIRRPRIYWDVEFNKRGIYVHQTDLQKEICFLQEEIKKVNINHGNTTHELIDKCSSEIEITLKELKDEIDFDVIESKIQELKKKMDKKVVSFYMELYPPVAAE